MPMAAKKQCRKYGCRGYQTEGGYCEEHQHLANREDNRPAAHVRGYDSAWSKFRAIYLRQHPLCSACQNVAAVVHHIKPLDDGGSKYDEINLMPLCRECHERVHGRAL